MTKRPSTYAENVAAPYHRRVTEGNFLEDGALFEYWEKNRYVTGRLVAYNRLARGNANYATLENIETGVHVVKRMDTLQLSSMVSASA